jgi:trans-aconitate methyltransferase
MRLENSALTATDLWESSAQKYNAFEQKWHYYSRVAKPLVRTLKIKDDSRILELASGTGACTILLAHKCPRGEVVCVERSKKMIAIAERNLGSNYPNVSFIESDVSKLGEKMRKKFAFVVCNSAFWQFREYGKLLKTLQQCLDEKGKLAFNIPFWFNSKTEERTYREGVNDIISKNGMDPSVFWSKRKAIDYADLLRENGFQILIDSRYEIKMDRKEVQQWRKIPIFSRQDRSYRDLPPKVSLEIQRWVQAFRKLHAEKVPKSRWRLIVGLPA